MKIFKCWIVGYPLLKIPSPKKYEIYLFIFLQEERDEIDEINAGDHDNMTYEVPLLFYPGRTLRGGVGGGCGDDHPLSLQIRRVKIWFTRVQYYLEQINITHSP